MDHLLVELIILQSVVASQGGEFVRGDEGQEQAALAAMRAVALHHLGEIDGHLVADAAAVAAAGVRSWSLALLISPHHPAPSPCGVLQGRCKGVRLAGKKD